MKLSVKSANLIAVSVAVTTDHGCEITVPVLYDPASKEVLFLGDDDWDNPEQFSEVIGDYIRSSMAETPEPINEQTWLKIQTLQALAKPPSKK